jgi:outer membrane receptor protein involved in Fe transport
MIDLLNNPYWSSDPVRKADASLSWTRSKFNTTLYANWFDSTPNYAATITDKGYQGNRAGKLPSHINWNLSLGYNPIPQLQLSFMVNNVFDKMPPMDWSYPGTSGAPYNGGNFDVYGRAYYMEAKYLFGGK